MPTLSFLFYIDFVGQGASLSFCPRFCKSVGTSFFSSTGKEELSLAELRADASFFLSTGSWEADRFCIFTSGYLLNLMILEDRMMKDGAKSSA